MPLKIRNPRTHHVFILLLFTYFIVDKSVLSLNLFSERSYAESVNKVLFARQSKKDDTVNCNRPTLPNGGFEGEAVSEGTRLSARCNIGYRLKDPIVHFVECQQDGTWTGHDGSQPTKSFPECILWRTECDYPMIIENGKPDFASGNTILEFPVGYTFTYVCDPGYVMKGQSTYKCSKRRKWDPSYSALCQKSWDIPTTIATTAEPPPKKSINSTIMQVLLYVSIPLLLILAVAIACNIKKRATRAKTIRERVQQNATNELPADISHQPPNAPLLEDGLHNEQLRPASYMSVEDAECLPPSYEEAMTQDRPPSFRTVQRSAMYQ